MSQIEAWGTQFFGRTAVPTVQNYAQIVRAMFVT